MQTLFNIAGVLGTVHLTFWRGGEGWGRGRGVAGGRSKCYDFDNARKRNNLVLDQWERNKMTLNQVKKRICLC